MAAARPDKASSTLWALPRSQGVLRKSCCASVIFLPANSRPNPAHTLQTTQKFAFGKARGPERHRCMSNVPVSLPVNLETQTAQQTSQGPDPTPCKVCRRLDCCLATRIPACDGQDGHSPCPRSPGSQQQGLGWTLIARRDMRHGPSASTRVGQLLSGPARASASSGSVAQRQPAAGEAAQGPAAIKQEQGAEPPAGPQLPQWPQRKAARPAKLGRAADAAGPAAAPVLGAAPGERVASGSGKRGPGGTAAAAAAAAAAGAAPRAGKERSPKGGGQAVLASFWEPGAVAGVAYEGGGPLDKRRPPWAVFLSRPLVGARRPRPAQRSLKEMGRFFLK